MRTTHLLIALFAAVFWCDTARADVPARVELTIEVEARGMKVGEGRDVFEHDGKRYTVRTEAKTVGVARLIKRMDEKRESRGAITERGLRPEFFHQERTGKAPNEATFDWTKKELTLNEGGDIEKLPLPVFTLDQTSLAYTYVFAEPPTDRFHVYVTDGKRLTDYNVAFVGKEMLDSPLGKLETLHFRKIQAPDDKRGFEFWLSTAHHRLPVRIRIVEKDGTAFDSTVIRIDYGSP